MAEEKLFSEKTLRRILKQYTDEMRISEQAAERILCALLGKPPP